MITRDEAVQLWTHILRHGIAEIFQAPGTSAPLRAEACAALATVGSQIFECLPVNLRTSCSSHLTFEIIAALFTFTARSENPLRHADPRLRQ